MMRRESADIFPHSRQRVPKWTLIQIGQRYRDVSRVAELGCGNGFSLESGDERFYFGIAYEVLRFQTNQAGANFVQSQRRTMAPRIDRMNPAG